ncbi:phage tail protein [Burkholderia gladioli]|uniref:phage tail-collar fiber domain-containing protein n=1 Tax=Burkholderia gladioli TaxID=28095 RepID=UPI001ABB7238|nr:phage tail protein [Burkholderia gladioli]
MYKTIHTKYGRQRMAAAEVAGEKINIVAVAIGDGGGNPAPPNDEQTQLVREVFRTTPNRVYQDPMDPQKYTIEIVVPAKIGGFTMREACAIDDRGGMFVVSNVPETYKPEGDGTEGSFSDTVLNLEFVSSNADIVVLQVDPNVAVATQQWVGNTITIAYLLKGGTTGQVLVKQSNFDGDVIWKDPTTTNVTVSIVDEQQALAAGQTAVTLRRCSTVGLAVYVDGKRVPPNGWTADAVDRRKFTLATAAADGSQLYAVQNDPTAQMAPALAQASNLADVLSPPDARANLGVDSKANTDTHAPAGMVAYFAVANAPTGWLKCNGAAISRLAYQLLFSKIGTTFGAGDGFNTFNLPELRGEFIRSWDDGRGIDPGRGIGPWQGSQNLSHAHTTYDPGHVHSYSSAPGLGQGSPGVNSVQQSSGASTTGRAWTGLEIQASGGNESRPRNVALLACIKY